MSSPLFLFPYSLFLAAERLLIGGQAVIEGVMMRSPRWTSTAVRRPTGEVVDATERVESLRLRHRWLRVPIVRGAITLYEALKLGVRALFFSAREAHGESEPQSPAAANLSIAMGLGLAIGLFFVLPAALIRLFDRFFGTVYVLNLGEGAIRIAVLIGYITIIGRLGEIRRVFEYHGAEHKAVNAYEAGARLQVNEVRRFSRFHPRCGTSFLLIVMIVAIVVFSFLGRPGLLVRIAQRIVLIPVVAGISYEVIRAGARYRWFRPLVVPGMWLQRLTTREPEDQQLDVAIHALQEVLEREQPSTIMSVR
ncbi:MAG TPA: DUF1385 domain-containing protein [bacterium]|nr:DUF1385 domain-containing protein [bacterium]